MNVADGTRLERASGSRDRWVRVAGAWSFWRCVRPGSQWWLGGFWGLTLVLRPQPRLGLGGTWREEGEGLLAGQAGAAVGSAGTEDCSSLRAWARARSRNVVQRHGSRPRFAVAPDQANIKRPFFFFLAKPRLGSLIVKKVCFFAILCIPELFQCCLPCARARAFSDEESRENFPNRLLPRQRPIRSGGKVI